MQFQIAKNALQATVATCICFASFAMTLRCRDDYFRKIYANFKTFKVKGKIIRKGYDRV